MGCCVSKGDNGPDGSAPLLGSSAWLDEAFTTDNAEPNAPSARSAAPAPARPSAATLPVSNPSVDQPQPHQPAVALGVTTPPSAPAPALRAAVWKSSAALFSAALQACSSSPAADVGQKLLATFQRLLEIPVIGPVDQRARVEGVQRLQSEFGAVIRAVVATIVREIPLGPLDKSVKLIPTPPEQPDPITLFAHKGVAFRLIDSDDISSCKLAGREAASTDALLQCCLPNLQFPLCVCVDYLGWRVLATPILPLSSSSMVSAVKFPDTCVSPSSPDRAVVVVQDSRLDALFEMVAQRLNLRRHRVSGNPASPPVWLGAHVEGHIGTDGRRYVINPPFIFPPIVSERAYVPQLFWCCPAVSGVPHYFMEVPFPSEGSVLLNEAILTELQGMLGTSTAVDLLSCPLPIGVIFVVGSIQQDQAETGMCGHPLNNAASSLLGSSVYGPVIVVPTASGSTVSNHYLRMRPELLAVSPGPLSSDGLSHANVLDDTEANRDLEVVTNMLFTRQIEEAAAALDDCFELDISTDIQRKLSALRGDVAPSDAATVGALSVDELLAPDPPISDSLKSHLHAVGVNLRYMGLVGRACESEEAKRCLLLEACARTLSHTVGQQLHAVQLQDTANDEIRKNTFVSALVTAIGLNPGSPSVDLRVLMWAKFPGSVVQNGDENEGDLDWLWSHGLDTDEQAWVLLRTCELLGVQLSLSSALVSRGGLGPVGITVGDIVGFHPVVKTPSVTYINELDPDAKSVRSSNNASMISGVAEVSVEDGVSVSLQQPATLDDPFMFQHAIAALQDELTVRENVLTPDDDRVIRCVRDLGTLYLMRPTTSILAKPLLHRVLQARPTDASVAMDLAELAIAEGDLVTANSFITLCEANCAPVDGMKGLSRRSFQQPTLDSMTVVRAMAKVAHLHSKCGNSQRAEAILTACLTAAQGFVGAHNPEYAVLLFQLGSLYQRSGQVQQAIQFLQQCCDVYGAIAKETLPTPSTSPRMSTAMSISSRRSMLASPTAANTTRDSFHRQVTHGSALLSLGSAYLSCGDSDRAASALEEALTVQAGSGGKYTHVYVLALRTLATVRLGKGEYKQADALLKECCALAPVVFGPSHPDSGAALQCHAEVLLRLGFVDKAATTLQACAHIQRACGDPDYLQTLQQLSGLYVTSRKPGKAIDTLLLEREVLARRGLSVGGKELVANARSLVSLYKSTQQLTDAISLLESQLAAPIESTDDKLMLMRELADVYKVTDRKAEAIPLLEEVCASLSLSRSPDIPRLVSCLSALGWAYAATGNFTAAIQSLQKCVDLRTGPPAHPGYGESLLQLGRAVKLSGDPLTAAQHFAAAAAALGPASGLQYLEALEGQADALCVGGRDEEAAPLMAQCEALRAQIAPGTRSTITTPRASARRVSVV